MFRRCSLSTNEREKEQMDLSCLCPRSKIWHLDYWRVGLWNSITPHVGPYQNSTNFTRFCRRWWKIGSWTTSNQSYNRKIWTLFKKKTRSLSISSEGFRGGGVTNSYSVQCPKLGHPLPPPLTKQSWIYPCVWTYEKQFRSALSQTLLFNHPRSILRWLLFFVARLFIPRILFSFLYYTLPIK